MAQKASRILIAGVSWCSVYYRRILDAKSHELHDDSNGWKILMRAAHRTTKRLLSYVILTTERYSEDSLWEVST